ncbi:hypothetical protein [Sporolituus thermophilus]|uniref:Uncharacterized protein n=1 Tax=Sporolituus thermophilus DSM 23256 TaxID=1123285 RepID=A0A1G7L306_9FIRM|nr:hypothetical protein [Sporolituus thermophilus]SDF43399.1 hypothetical protein SAMN05660235_01592 [Sporolituus thermophilus DSM 23256]
MALPADVHDIVEVFLIQNLAALGSPTVALIFPADPLLIQTVVINSFDRLTLPSDYQEILDIIVLYRL